MKKISNPLTIIGLFAGIAEVAGTIVLPFVAESLQNIFIWYVMGFPVFLVSLFFYTLVKHNLKLYAPSDFDEEENFMALQNIGKAIQEVEKMSPDMSEKLQPIKNSYENAISIQSGQIKQIYPDRILKKILQFLQTQDRYCTVDEIAKGINVKKDDISLLMTFLMHRGKIIMSHSENNQVTYKMWEK